MGGYGGHHPLHSVQLDCGFHGCRDTSSVGKTVEKAFDCALSCVVGGCFVYSCCLSVSSPC